MAKYDKIPDEHHLVRHVPFARLRRDGDGNVIGLEALAFEIRQGEEYLSASWLEYEGGMRVEQLKRILGYIRKSRKAGSKSGLAVGLVKDIIAACRPAKVRVLHYPEDTNPAHAGVTQFPGDESEVLELLATTAWAELLMVGDLDAIP